MSCCNPRVCGRREPSELERQERGGRVTGTLGHGAAAAGRGLPARVPPAAGHARWARRPGSRGASAQGGLGAAVHRACLMWRKKGGKERKERKRNPPKIKLGKKKGQKRGERNSRPKLRAQGRRPGSSLTSPRGRARRAQGLRPAARKRRKG